MFDIVPIARSIIVENMNDFVIVLDTKDRIIDFNLSVQKYLDFNISKMIGQPAEIVLNKFGDLFKRYKNIQSAKDEITIGEKENQKFFDLSISPIQSANGHYLGRLIILHDISELKQAEEQIKLQISALESASKQIKASLEEKEILLKEIHHRVKNNLQVVSSLLNLQSRYIKDEEAIKVFEESQKRVEVMALIHEKLYLSKDLTSINFSEYTKGLIIDLFESYGVNYRDIKLNIDINNTSLGIDAAIPCALIINELISNSLKYAFPKRTDSGESQNEISVKFCNEQDKYTLIISDNGVGLPEGFDLQNSKSLGLRLVYILTKQLNGNLEINNNNGTEFKITFIQPDKT
jgi:PAS domain S-box-containing protein